MNADVKGALNQIDKSWKAFTVKGYNLTKPAVKRILEYALAKGYDHTGQISDAEIDHLLNKGTTIEQWERYYVESKEFEERMQAKKPVKPEVCDKCEQPQDHPELMCECSFLMKQYERNLSEWQMARSCDAPNKPGYYRANND